MAFGVALELEGVDISMLVPSVGAAAVAQPPTRVRRVEGGWMNGETLSPDQMDSIARLPTRDVLYGRLVGMVASPLTGLVTSLGGLIGGLARQLSQIAEQRLVGGAGPAPAAAAPAESAPEAEAAAEPAPAAEPEAEAPPEPEAAAEPEAEAASEPQSDLPTDTNEE